MNSTGMTDFSGNELFEGDKCEHPSGQFFVVARDLAYKNHWRAVYSDGESLSLGLQVGDKGQAVKVKGAKTL